MNHSIDGAGQDREHKENVRKYPVRIVGLYPAARAPESRLPHWEPGARKELSKTIARESKHLEFLSYNLLAEEANSHACMDR